MHVQVLFVSRLTDFISPLLVSAHGYTHRNSRFDVWSVPIYGAIWKRCFSTAENRTRVVVTVKFIFSILIISNSILAISLRWLFTAINHQTADLETWQWTYMDIQTYIHNTKNSSNTVQVLTLHHGVLMQDKIWNLYLYFGKWFVINRPNVTYRWPANLEKSKRA